MKLLITGAASDLGRHLGADLSVDHDVRLTDSTETGTPLQFVLSDLEHGEVTDQLVADIDVIVHPAYIGSHDEPASQWLDRNTRCTYNLLLAGTQAGVKRVIYLSVLDMFTAYDFDMTVTEEWRPRPSCEPDQMGPYIGEFVAREFAHSGAMDVLILRLGHVVTAEQAAGQPYDPMWTDVRDVAGAVRAALKQTVQRYGVFHLQHVSPRARFRNRGGRHSLDYTPQHNFGENA